MVGKGKCGSVNVWGVEGGYGWLSAKSRFFIERVLTLDAIILGITGLECFI